VIGSSSPSCCSSPSSTSPTPGGVEPSSLFVPKARSKKNLTKNTSSFYFYFLFLFFFLLLLLLFVCLFVWIDLSKGSKSKKKSLLVITPIGGGGGGEVSPGNTDGDANRPMEPPRRKWAEVI
jgi:hypothetical protein